MPKAYSEGINKKYCYSIDIDKPIPMHFIQYMKEMVPNENCDNSLNCSHDDCIFHNDHPRNTSGINYLLKPI